MRRIRKFIEVASVNVILVLLLVELSGVVTFYVKTDQLFYRRPRLEQPPPEAVEAHAQTRHVLHPILGFTRRPGLPVTDIATRDRLDRLVGPGLMPSWGSLTANNFGFFSSHDYPYTPPENSFLIGVFGGSVAQWFALQGASVLIDRLKHMPELEGRHIEVLNYAQGSYKQPQQLHILSYFLSRGQSLDFILNIDGFNEVALSLENVERGIDPSLPASQQLLPMVALLERNALNLEQIETFARVKRGTERLQSLEEQMSGVWSAGAWLVLEVLRQHTAQRYSVSSRQLAASIEKASPNLMYLNPWLEAGKSEGTMGFVVSVWMRASTLMDDILRAHGIPYLHIIQPNQYFSRKTFTGEERRVAINANTPYAKNVEQGYPHLLEQVPAMQSQRVYVVSAVDVFDAIPQTVYADNCCHYNQLGNEIFARFIADHMARTIASQ